MVAYRHFMPVAPALGAGMLLLRKW